MNIRDGAAYLREALDSVLSQTFLDWELIAWDDQSTDNSAEIVSEYRDQRVRYFYSEVNTGLGTARQLAVEQAGGEWLAFIDQDDIWTADKLQKQMGLLALPEGEKVGILYGRTVSLYPNGEQQDFDAYHEFSSLPQGDIFLELLEKSCFVNMSSGMLLRSAFLEIGGIPSEYQLACDYHLFVAIARKYQARAVDDVVCFYRVHDDSMSHVYREPMIYEALTLLDQWAPLVPAEVLTRAKRTHYALLTAGDLHRARTFFRGIVRAFQNGCASLVFFWAVAHPLREVRRKWWPATWSASSPHPEATRSSQSASPERAPLALSLIVVNWNVRDLLRECLHAVYRETTLPPDAWEVIVIDNDSPDGSAEMVRREFPTAKLVAKSENVGFARANNEAFQLSRGEFLLLLNPDTVVVNHAIDRMLERANSDPAIGALGCRLVNPDGSIQRWQGGDVPTVANSICHFLLFYRLFPEWMLPKPIFREREPAGIAEAGWVSGACMMLRREAVVKGLFDPRFFMYGEDLELCDRLSSAGWKVLYWPTVQIVHYGGQSTDAQAPEVQLKRLQSLRELFLMRNGQRWLWCFDLSAFIGFTIRSLGYALAARMRPGRGFESRARRSRMLREDALRTLLRAGSPTGSVNH